MDRSEFLSKLGVGLAVVCAGCSIAGCGSSKGNDPAPAKPPTPAAGSGTLFNLDLTNTLVNIGDSTTSDGVIVVRLAAANVATSFTAVQVACTHQGTTIGYNAAQGIFICPLHGSEFSKGGQVLQGPAAKALQQYTVTVVNDSLTVSA